ncbi:unnamed protein product [Meganyctiphanes norvegica]|uniref:Uncharacterized protein n=1 Tax=Meganyctiphanes norvegica TaxID=48144 RepID=A0AAV2SV27_MEGNR
MNPSPSWSNSAKASFIIPNVSSSFILVDSITVNSCKSSVPFSFVSTCRIMSRTCSFDLISIPSDFITVSTSSGVIRPSPSSSNVSKALLKSASCSSVKFLTIVRYCVEQMSS